MIQVKALQHELEQLPAEEKLQLAHWLLDSVLTKKERPLVTIAETNPLLAVAGMFNGGPGDTAERAEEILKDELNVVEGFQKP